MSIKLLSTSSKKRSAAAAAARDDEDDREEEHDHHSAEPSQNKRRKKNEDHIQMIDSIIWQYQQRINSYEIRIKQDPQMEQIFRSIINEEKVRIQRLENDAMALHFEML